MTQLTTLSTKVNVTLAWGVEGIRSLLINTTNTSTTAAISSLQQRAMLFYWILPHSTVHSRQNGGSGVTPHPHSGARKLDLSPPRAANITFTPPFLAPFYVITSTSYVHCPHQRCGCPFFRHPHHPTSISVCRRQSGWGRKCLGSPAPASIAVTLIDSCCGGRMPSALSPNSLPSRTFTVIREVGGEGETALGVHPRIHPSNQPSITPRRDGIPTPFPLPTTPDTQL